MKNLKIGITISLMNYSESIWTNGLKQNILMFIHLLKQSKNNYEVFLLNTNKVEGDDAKKGNYLKDIDIFYFDDKYMEMDLIFPMGSQIHEEKVLKFKECLMGRIRTLDRPAAQISKMKLKKIG